MHGPTKCMTRKPVTNSFNTRSSSQKSRLRECGPSRKTRSSVGGVSGSATARLREQEPRRPTAGVTHELLAMMQPAQSRRPELDDVRRHAKARPEQRARYVTVGE